jgi:hypothetical protein
VDALTECAFFLYMAEYRREVSPQYDYAEQTYQLAIEAIHLQGPHIARLDSSSPDNTVGKTQFLDVLFGLALAQMSLRKFEDAINGFQQLVELNFLHAVMPLYSLYLQCGDYKAGEALKEKWPTGRDFDFAYDKAFLQFGLVLINFQKFKAGGSCSEETLCSMMAKAIECNSFVLPIILEEGPQLPERKWDEGCPGSMQQATNIVFHFQGPFQQHPELLNWIYQLKNWDGEKPDDDGKTLFRLLRNGKILVNTSSATNMSLTTCLHVLNDELFVHGDDDDVLPDGMKEHGPAKIVAYNQEEYEFVSFSYDDVVSVLFWKVLKSSKDFGMGIIEECCRVCKQENPPFVCSECLTALYCGEECQREDWEGDSPNCTRPPHKLMCPKLQKT